MRVARLGETLALALATNQSEDGSQREADSFTYEHAGERRA